MPRQHRKSKDRKPHTPPNGLPQATGRQARAAPTDWNSLPLVLTIEQVAQVLGIGRDSAYALARQPGFPAVVAGRRKMVSRDALKRWLEQAETRPATRPRDP